MDKRNDPKFIPPLLKSSIPSILSFSFLTKCFILLIRFYQITISPFMGPCCRFYPTCSNYMIEAVKTHGILKGGWRGLKRLCKCHPWHPGGHDPVDPNQEE